MTQLRITREALLADPCVSFWLKGMVRETESRDLLDCLQDAELLARLLRQEWSQIQSAAVPAAINRIEFAFDDVG